jgi:hypothetical protein
LIIDVKIKRYDLETRCGDLNIMFLPPNPKGLAKIKVEYSGNFGCSSSFVMSTGACEMITGRCDVNAVLWVLNAGGALRNSGGG